MRDGEKRITDREPISLLKDNGTVSALHASLVEICENANARAKAVDEKYNKEQEDLNDTTTTMMDEKWASIKTALVDSGDIQVGDELCIEDGVIFKLVTEESPQGGKDE